MYIRHQHPLESSIQRHNLNKPATIRLPMRLFSQHRSKMCITCQAPFRRYSTQKKSHRAAVRGIELGLIKHETNNSGWASSSVECQESSSAGRLIDDRFDRWLFVSVYVRMFVHICGLFLSLRSYVRSGRQERLPGQFFRWSYANELLSGIECSFF